MGGRHAAATQGFHGKEGVLLAVAHRRPTLEGVCLFLSTLSLFAVPSAPSATAVRKHKRGRRAPHTRCRTSGKRTNGRADQARGVGGSPRVSGGEACAPGVWSGVVG